MASLVGFLRVRRHSHHHARSAPQCGVSHGPRAFRVRVPIACSGVRFGDRRQRVDLGDLLELAEIFLAVAGEPARHPAIGQKLGDIAARHRQMQVVDPLGFFDRFDLRLQRRQFALHARDLLA